MNIRMALPPAAVIVAMALAGCSLNTPGTGGSATTPPAPTASAATPSASSTPIASTPSASAPSTGAASTGAASTGAAAGTQQQGSLTATITIIDTTTGLVPGGPFVRFMVTVTNDSAQTYSNILPLVSLGHCFCTPNTLFPAGTLQERESTTNVWQTIPYDVEGFGTDYLNVMEPGGIQSISPQATATFEYRLALSPASSAQVTRGMGAIDVTLIALPGHTPIGRAPTADAPVDVQSGQPPV
jgi:hypothetical protein